MKQHTMFLGQSDIDDIIGIMTSLRLDDCVIGRKSSVVDRGGADVETWTYDANVSCSIQPMNRDISESQHGGRLIPDLDVLIHLPLTAVVERDWQVLHVQSGRTYDVINDPNAATYGYDLVCHGKDTE